MKTDFIGVCADWMCAYGWWLMLTGFAFAIIVAFASDIYAKHSLKKIEEKKQAEYEARQQKHIEYMLQNDANWYGEHSRRSVKSCLPPKIEGEPIERT